MKKKRVATLALALLMGLVLTACGQSGAPQSSSSQGSSAPSSAAPGDVQIPSPMVEYSQPDFMDRAGFAVSTLPEGWLLEKCYLIEMPDAGSAMGDLRLLTPEGEKVILRMQANGERSDISGVYGEPTQVEEKTVEGRQLQFLAHGEQWVVLWHWEGFTYSLMTEADAPVTQERIEAMMDLVIAETTVVGSSGSSLASTAPGGSSSGK